MKKILFSALLLLTSVILAQAPNDYVAFYEFTNGSSANSVAPSNSQQSLRNLLTSNFVQDRHGQAQSAYRFYQNNTSSGGYLYTIPSNNVPIPEFTTSFWYKSTTNAPSSTEIMMQCFQANTPQSGWRISRTSNDALSFRISYNNGVTSPNRHKTFDLSNSSVFDGQWHHIVLRIKTTLTNGVSVSNAGVYIDGVKNTTASQGLSGFGNPFWNSNAGFVISPTSQFNGALDDIQLYKRGVTDNEVSAIYLSQAPCTGFVNIPNANFKAALLDHGVGITGANISVIDTDGDGEICQTEAQAYTGRIYVANKYINDLTGIEAFTALTELVCSFNSLTSLDLSANTALTLLYAQDNVLTSLNVANGNNGNLSAMYAHNHPNLTCIQHDAGFDPTTNANWRKDATAIWSDNCAAASINDVTFSNAVTVYPNPASSTLYISANNTQINTIEIYNVLGKKVLTTQQEEVPVSNLPNGMYIVKIQSTEGKIATKKFIKQ